MSVVMPVRCVVRTTAWLGRRERQIAPRRPVDDARACGKGRYRTVARTHISVHACARSPLQSTKKYYRPGRKKLWRLFMMKGWADNNFEK